jgi:hypothetical protein
MSAPYCSACAEIAGEVSAPGGVILDDGLWFVSHHTGRFTDPGELIVKTKRHCESLGELTAAEAAPRGDPSRRHRGPRAGGRRRTDLRRLVQ